jgi:hypothetical protein
MAKKELTVEERLKALETENAELKKAVAEDKELEKGMSNEEILQKAAITTADIAAAGRLNDAQADMFIDFVIDVTGLKGKTRVVRFRNDKLDIDKIGVGRRVAVAKKEAKDPGVRRKANFSKVTLQPEEIMVPWELSDEFVMENLEGERVEDTIMRLMATQMSNDLEELYIQGDKLGAVVPEGDLVDGGSPTDVIVDTYLKLQDGWLKLAGQSHVVDHDGQNISHQVFSDMIVEMPSKFKKNKRNLKFFISDTTEQLFRNNLAARATGLGDQAATSEMNLMPFGIELVPLALLPQTPLITQHVTLTGTTPVALDHKNLVVGGETVVLQSIDDNPLSPVTPYVEGVDYDMDYAAGTIARNGGGALSSPSDVKISYLSQSQMWLTEFRNMILGIGRDIQVEKDRNIYSSVTEFAMTARVAVQMEETDACVLGINIGLN